MGDSLFWKTLHCITVLIRRSDYHWSIIFCFGNDFLNSLFGLTEAGDLKQYLNSPPGKGPIVCVSAASGATGSVVVQIAKNLLGASKVIGISGSSENANGLRNWEQIYV